MWSKIPCQINQGILKASINNQQFENSSNNVHVVGKDSLRTFESFNWSVKKHCIGKVLLAI